MRGSERAKHFVGADMEFMREAHMYVGEIELRNANVE
jgi:hypothetical protein